MKNERYILKSWVKKALFIIQLLLFIIIVCEFETIKLELLVKIPVMIVLLFNHYLIENQTDLFEKGI